MLLFMISSGLTLVFGVLGIINFAHGSLYMLGAYLGISLMAVFPQMGGSFWLSLIVSSLIVAVCGGAIEMLFLRRVYKADHIYQLLLTYALVMIIDALVKMIWGLRLLSDFWKAFSGICPLHYWDRVYDVFFFVAIPDQKSVRHVHSCRRRRR